MGFHLWILFLYPSLVWCESFSLFVFLLSQSSGVMESVPVHVFCVTPSHSCFVEPVNVPWFVLVTLVFITIQYVKKRTNGNDEKQTKWSMDLSKVLLNVRTPFCFSHDASASLVGLEILENVETIHHPPLYTWTNSSCYISIKLCTLFSVTEGWLRSFSRRHLVTSSANICTHFLWWKEDKKKNSQKLQKWSLQSDSKSKIKSATHQREAGTLFDLTTNWLWFISKDHLISLSPDCFGSKGTEKNILTGLSNTIHRSFYYEWRE